MSQSTPSKEGRIERHLMRQRGAGVRSVTADFGFSFAPTIVPNASIEPPTKRRKIVEDEGDSAIVNGGCQNAALKRHATASVAVVSDAGLRAPTVQGNGKVASLDRGNRSAGTGIDSIPQPSTTARQEEGSSTDCNVGHFENNGRTLKEKPQASAHKVKGALQSANDQEFTSERVYEAGLKRHQPRRVKGSAVEAGAQPTQAAEIAVPTKDCDDAKPSNKPPRLRKKTIKDYTGSRAAESNLDEVEDSFVAGLKPRKKGRKGAKKDQEEAAAADVAQDPTSVDAPTTKPAKENDVIVASELPTEAPPPAPAPEPEPPKKRSCRKRMAPEVSEPAAVVIPPSCRPRRQAAASATERVSRGYDQEASAVDKLRRAPEPEPAKPISKSRKRKISPVEGVPVSVDEEPTSENAPEPEEAPEPEVEVSAVAPIPTTKKPAARSRKAPPARANAIVVSAALGAILGIDMVDNDVYNEDGSLERSTKSAPKGSGRLKPKKAQLTDGVTDSTATTAKKSDVKVSRARTTSASSKTTKRTKKAPEPGESHVEPITEIPETQEVPVDEELAAKPKRPTATKGKGIKSKKKQPDDLHAEAEDIFTRNEQQQPPSEGDRAGGRPQDDEKESSNEKPSRPFTKRKRALSAQNASETRTTIDLPPSKVAKVAGSARAQSRAAEVWVKSKERPALAQTDVNISRPSMSPEKLKKKKPEKRSSSHRIKEAPAVAETVKQSKIGNSNRKLQAKDAAESPAIVGGGGDAAVETHPEATVQPAKAAKAKRRIAKDEDIDWLFAAAEPKRQRAAAKTAPKSRSGTAARRGCKDMDLDDLLDNIAAFSR